MFSLRKKQRICRFYNEDIWGVLRLKQTLSHTFVLLIKGYREKRAPVSLFSKTLIRKPRRRALYGELLTSRKKLSYFYGGIKTVVGRNKVNQEQKLHKFYSVLLEWDTRLSSILFRSNLAVSILDAFHLVFSGGVTVDREVITDPTYLLKEGQVVELIESRKGAYYRTFLEKLSLQLIPIVQPIYLEVSPVLLSVILLRKPLLKELHYPFSVTL